MNNKYIQFLKYLERYIHEIKKDCSSEANLYMTAIIEEIDEFIKNNKDEE